MKASKKKEAAEHFGMLSQWGMWRPDGENLDFQLGVSSLDAEEILEYLHAQDAKEDAHLLEHLANLPDSLTALNKFRDRWPLLADGENDASLLRDRDRLRLLWADDHLDNHYSTTGAWLMRKGVDVPGAWKYHLMAGVIRPHRNLGARLARAVTRLFDRMKVCANPDCRRYFIARTTRRIADQSKYCMAAGCRRYARNERSLRSYHAIKKRKRRSVRGH